MKLNLGKKPIPFINLQLMKRRSLIKSVAAATIGAPLVSFNKPESSNNLSLKKIKHNPIGVSTYSFWQFNGRETPIEYCIDKASEFGFDGIELLLIQMESEENSYLQKLKKRSFDAGLDIMGLSTHQSFVSPDVSKRKENIDLTNFSLSDIRTEYMLNDIDVYSQAKINFDNKFVSNVKTSFKDDIGKKTFISCEKGKIVIENNWNSESTKIEIVGKINKILKFENLENIYSLEIKYISNDIIKGKTEASERKG